MDSYFGMRRIECRDGILYLNGKPVFQRLVLDQGFYPDGIYTAPTAAELEADIDRSLAMGFNGARLHREGVLSRSSFRCATAKGTSCRASTPTGGWISPGRPPMRISCPNGAEVLARDFNHPAIIGWCPLNETQPNRNPLSCVCLPPSPGSTTGRDCTLMPPAGRTSRTDRHHGHPRLRAGSAAFAERLAPLAGDGTYNVHRFFGHGYELEARPTFVSEYGGIRWAPSDAAGWGYGQAPLSEQEFWTVSRG